MAELPCSMKDGADSSIMGEPGAVLMPHFLRNMCFVSLCMGWTSECGFSGQPGDVEGDDFDEELLLLNRGGRWTWTGKPQHLN